jgi:hypothetical protein
MRLIDYTKKGSQHRREKVCLASNKRHKTLSGSIKIDPALIPKFKKWEVVLCILTHLDPGQLKV